MKDHAVAAHSPDMKTTSSATKLTTLLSFLGLAGALSACGSEKVEVADDRENQGQDGSGGSEGSGSGGAAPLGPCEGAGCLEAEIFPPPISSDPVEAHPRMVMPGDEEWQCFGFTMEELAGKQASSATVEVDNEEILFGVELYRTSVSQGGMMGGCSLAAPAGDLVYAWGTGVDGGETFNAVDGLENLVLRLHYVNSSELTGFDVSGVRLVACD